MTRSTILLFIALAVSAFGQAFPGTAAYQAAFLKPAAAGGVPANLVGWWKLNDGSGTSAADATGNGNTGTRQGHTAWGTGPNGNGDLVLDGTGDYVDIANETQFDFDRDEAFSVSCWVKANSSIAGTVSILGKIQTSGNQPGYEIVYDTDNARVKFQLLQANGAAFLQSVSTPNSVPVNTWKLVTATYDASSTVAGCKIYINGSLDVAGTAGGPLTDTILYNEPFQIGKGSSGATFYGEIDDARVYSVELTSGEVSALNSGGAQ
jgi:hypothetical protein